MGLFDIKGYLQENKQLIDEALDGLLPAQDVFPPQVHKAMRHCLFAGGKRLRPILACAACRAVGGDPGVVVQEACALELIHTYSLIHDDLPAMDDDDYRRGCLSTHKVFGEAIAILAGDGLLTEAFAVLTRGFRNTPHAPEKLLEVIHLVAEACGSRGLIGGQVVDLESEQKVIEKDLLEYIHNNKTGKLLTASVLLGALLGGADRDKTGRLEQYGRAIGLAFQITDDILDILGSTEELGKKVGSDLDKGKATYPGIMGMDASKKMQQKLYEDACSALEGFDEKAEPLRAIAKLIVERTK